MKAKAMILSLVLALAGAVAAQLGGGPASSAWAVGSHYVVGENPSRPVTAGEARKIEAYMRQVFRNPGIRLVHLPPEAEVWLGDSFLGIVYPDDQSEGRTFYFEMAIFEEEAGESSPSKRHR